MADLRIGRRRDGYEVLVRLRPGEEREAKETARRNGADDVLVRTGAGQTYVASGSVLDLSRVKVGMQAELAGQQVIVTAVDDAANTAEEGWRRGASRGAIGVGVASFISLGAYGLAHGLGHLASGLQGLLVAQLLKAGTAVGGLLLVAWAACAALGAAEIEADCAATRRVDFRMLRDHGESVPLP